MKILSNDYKEYHDKLMKLNDKLSKELGIKYDENMRVIIVKDKLIKRNRFNKTKYKL